MVQIAKDNFSIGQICQSGQCFRLKKLEGAEETQERKGSERYALTAFGRYLEIEQKQKEIFFDCTQEEFESLWKSYFDLEEDYGRIIASIDIQDKYLLRAAAYGSGIRILRQDLWEMVISFIISQQNNIKRIRKCIEALCEKYGEEKYTEDGTCYYTFPEPEALAVAELKDLYACNLGYRSKYVKKTAQSIAAGERDLAAIKEMEYEAAVEELCKLSGVGIKVANCICLFALHKTEAFPVDTHINKVLREQYPDGFPFERYSGYAGTVQQYIFYYDLMKQSV